MNTTPNPIRRAAIYRVQSEAVIQRPAVKDPRRLSLPVREVPEERQAPLEIFTAPKARRSRRSMADCEEKPASPEPTEAKNKETPRRRSVQQSDTKTTPKTGKRRSEENVEVPTTPKKKKVLEVPNAPRRPAQTGKMRRNPNVVPPKLDFFLI